MGKWLSDLSGKDTGKIMVKGTRFLFLRLAHFASIYTTVFSLKVMWFSSSKEVIS
jgi:hypothetical protein